MAKRPWREFLPNGYCVLTRAVCRIQAGFMTRFRLTAAGLLLCFVVVALCDKKGADAPRIDCPIPLLDFGQVANENVIVREFRIRNTGGADLAIDKVRTSCGCTATEMARTTIPPGGQEPLRVRFKVGQRRGQQTKYIYVLSNDPLQPSYRLTLTGKVERDVVAEPGYLAFSSVRGGRPRPLKVTTPTGVPFRILAVETNAPDGVTARLTTIEEGNHYEVIAFCAASLPPSAWAPP